MTAENEPDGPAKVHQLHERQRLLGRHAGARRGWTNNGEHPLTIAYRKDQLIRGHLRDADGRERFNARDRLEAGEAYREVFERSHRTGRDSTDMDCVRGGRGDGITVTMQRAGNWLHVVDSKLGPQDQKIIAMVCGEGYWPSEAVNAACGPSYKFRTIPRLNEALDHLCAVLATLRVSRATS